MLILNRRAALKYSFAMVGSIIVITEASQPADANFFDDIGGAFKSGFNGLVDAGKTVVSTAVQGLNFATQPVQDLAKTALGIAGKTAETVLPAVAPTGTSSLPVRTCPSGARQRASTTGATPPASGYTGEDDAARSSVAGT